MHIFVWGSILSWFVLIPITSSQLFYSTFFEYVGVAYEVMATAKFWFYLPLATIVALFPTIVSRLISLYQWPTYVDFVRLKEKKEGKTIFTRKKIGRRLTSSRRSVKHNGYAFSHQGGFADLITSGHIFGMNKRDVKGEHERRHSRMTSSRPTSAMEPLTSANVGGTAISVSFSTIELDTPKLTQSNSEHQVSVKSEDKSVHFEDTEPPPPVLEELKLNTHEEKVVSDEVGHHNDETGSIVKIPGLVDSPTFGGEIEIEAAEAESDLEKKPFVEDTVAIEQ